MLHLRGLGIFVFVDQIFIDPERHQVHDTGREIGLTERRQVLLAVAVKKQLFFDQLRGGVISTTIDWETAPRQRGHHGIHQGLLLAIQKVMPGSMDRHRKQASSRKVSPSRQTRSHLQQHVLGASHPIELSADQPFQIKADSSKSQLKQCVHHRVPLRMQGQFGDPVRRHLNAC